MIHSHRHSSRSAAKSRWYDRAYGGSCETLPDPKPTGIRQRGLGHESIGRVTDIACIWKAPSLYVYPVRELLLETLPHVVLRAFHVVTTTCLSLRFLKQSGGLDPPSRPAVVRWHGALQITLTNRWQVRVSPPRIVGTVATALCSRGGGGGWRLSP